MYCNNCGNEIVNGNTFCTKCGNQNAAVMAAPKAAPAMGYVNYGQERQLLLAQMNSNAQLMGAIAERENAIEAMEENLPNIEKRTKMSHAVLLSIVIFMFAGAAIANFSVILFLLVWGGSTVAAVRNVKKYRKKLQDERAALENNKAQLEALKNDASLAWLPYDYRDSTSFRYMFGYLQNMRANTLQEAINLFEVEKHQAVVKAYSAISAQNAENAAAAARGAVGVAAATALFSLLKS